MKSILYLTFFMLLLGCKTPQGVTFVNTDTALGLEVAQNPISQLYQAKLGYIRTEIALAPTNENVVMEFNFNGLFSIPSGGFYQRVAIGPQAVQNSTLMFARDRLGALPPGTPTPPQPTK